MPDDEQRAHRRHAGPWRHPHRRPVARTASRRNLPSAAPADKLAPSSSKDTSPPPSSVVLSNGGQLSTHRVDHHRIIVLAENGRAGHEGVRPRGGDLADVVFRDTAVHFQSYFTAAGFD